VITELLRNVKLFGMKQELPAARKVDCHSHGSYGQRKSWKVREFISIRVQKLTKMQKKILNCCAHIAYNSSKFLLLVSLTDYLHLHFCICSTALVFRLSVIFLPSLEAWF